MRETPRNVLFIIFDDLNTQLDRYGPRPALTPNLDRLAARGVTFTRAYCQSPLCNPSRASLFAGHMPDRTGVHTLKEDQFGLKPRTITFPRLFRESGWFTARSGKVFHKGVPDSVCRCKAGKDDTNAWVSSNDPPGHELNSTGQIHAPLPYKMYPAGAGGGVVWLRSDDRKDEQQHDRHVASDVISWMEQEGDGPWFLAAGLIRPHTPLVAPERHFAVYDDWDIHVPDTSAEALADRPIQYNTFFGADMIGERSSLTNADHANAIRAYYASVSFADEQIGRMLDALEETGRMDDTLIVVTADHGFQLGEHGLWFKRFLYEESVRVPLIICDPSRPEGHAQTHEDPVELLDLFRTITDVMGVDRPPEVEGESLVPVLTAPARRTGRIARCQTGGVPGAGSVEGRSIRDRRWAYHEWRNAETQAELYDLAEDPRQVRNLADKAACADIVGHMRERLSRDPGRPQ